MSPCSDCPNLSCEITEPSIKEHCHARIAERIRMLRTEKNGLGLNK